MDRVLPAVALSADTVELRHGSVEAAWHLAGDRPLHLLASVDVARAGPLLVASMQATPSHGSFQAASQGSEPFYGVLFNLKGGQVVRNARHESRLEPGNILVWSSRVSSDFEVPTHLDKLQLLIPASRFERLWPHLVPQEQGWTWVQGRAALPTLSRCSVETLWHRRAEFEAEDLQSGFEAALDLLDQSLRRPRHAHRSKAERYEQVWRYIDRELEDPDLDPLQIAERHGCSVRALHALFAAFNTTVAGSIRQLRLERCRSALEGQHAERIGQVALRWGFSDAAHFSKLFKSTYGSSPRRFRDAALGAARSEMLG